MNVEIELKVKFRADNLIAANRFAEAMYVMAQSLYQNDYELGRHPDLTEETVTMEVTMSG